MSWEMETSGATGDPQKPVYVFARQLVVKDLYQLLCWGGVKEGGEMVNRICGWAQRRLSGHPRPSHSETHHLSK